MSVELDSAIDGAETFAQIEELLQDAEANWVIVDSIWQGRQVTSPNHPGFIDLMVLSKRVVHQFEQKGCPFEEAQTLKTLCGKISLWHEETAFQMLQSVTGIASKDEFLHLFMDLQPELEGLSEEEAIQLLVDREIFDAKQMPAFFEDIKLYGEAGIYNCELFNEDDDPSLWLTEAAWEYRFPGVEMPNSRGDVIFHFNGEKQVSFLVFDRPQIEAAKAQVEALDRLGA
ncbi:hypothetical protein [Simkania sp.]|uniref:hypothetical protein n=1 Tax=Simkania sp. TaxID=34094 RepID=UPI003B52BE69